MSTKTALGKFRIEIVLLCFFTLVNFAGPFIVGVLTSHDIIEDFGEDFLAIGGAGFIAAEAATLALWLVMMPGWVFKRMILVAFATPFLVLMLALGVSLVDTRPAFGDAMVFVGLAALGVCVFSAICLCFRGVSKQTFGNLSPAHQNTAVVKQFSTLELLIWTAMFALLILVAQSVTSETARRFWGVTDLLYCVPALLATSAVLLPSLLFVFESERSKVLWGSVIFLLVVIIVPLAAMAFGYYYCGWSFKLDTYAFMTSFLISYSSSLIILLFVIYLFGIRLITASKTNE